VYTLAYSSNPSSSMVCTISALILAVAISFGMAVI
jgi:hypothetical protein